MKKRATKKSHKAFWLNEIKEQEEEEKRRWGLLVEPSPVEPFIDDKSLKALWKDPWARIGLMWHLLGHDGLSITTLCYLTGRKSRALLRRELRRRGILEESYCVATHLNVWRPDAFDAEDWEIRYIHAWPLRNVEDDYDSVWSRSSYDAFAWEENSPSPTTLSDKEARCFGPRSGRTVISKKEWAKLKAAVAAGSR